MVNYDAITLGLEVEFLVEGLLCSGFVRYKGPLNGKEGDWLGIESRQSVGYCNGRLNGRTYFKCADGFGLFLTADELRLAAYKPKIKKNRLYKSVNCEVDEVLFNKKSIPNDDHVVCITEDYMRRAKSSFSYGTNDLFRPSARFATRENFVYRAKSAQKDQNSTVYSTSSNNVSFHPSASISRTFMPKDEMKLYSNLKWSSKNKNISLPRNTDLSNTFDGFNRSRQNYIEPAL